MTGAADIFAATEQKYGLPPGILRATAQVESHFNPNAVSPQGAQGMMQLLPSTAKSLGADPHNPVSAVDAAGRLWADNLKRSGGDIDRAAMMYHGGLDTRQWGPKTHAYPGKLAAALGPQASASQPEGGDPIEAALEGHPQPQQSAPQAAPADPNDPVEQALAGQATQSREAEIADAQGQASKLLAAGDEKGAQAILAQHGLQMAPGELDAFHAGKRSAGFNYSGAPQDQPAPEPQADQGLGFFAGVTKPIDNAATWLKDGADKLGIGQAITNFGQALGLPSLEQANAGHQAYIQQQEAQGKTPGEWGKIAGGIVGTLPIAAITKNPWLAGAVGGALDTDNPHDLKQTALAAGLGAVGGKAVDVGVGAVSGAIAPQVSSAVRKLGDMGVQLTPGQIMGGALRRVEDGATSIPFLGDLVKNAQRRSAVSLNGAVINDRVLKPIGKSLPEGMAGREAVDFADQKVSDAYERLLPKLTLQADQHFVQNASGILQRADELPADRATQVKNIIKNSLIGKFDPAGQMSGRAFQEGDAKLGQLARQYGASPDPEQRAMGGIFRDIQGEFRDLLERSNPQHQGELKPIRQAFANLVRVEGAAGSAGAKGGVFTANQLASAVKRFDSSPRKKAYATGKALMQDVSDPASEVLPSTVPDSGTPYRTLGAYLLGGGAAHVSPFAIPALAPFSLYSKIGQKAFQKAALAPRSASAKALASALTHLKAPLAIAGGGASAQAANGF